VRRSRRGGTDLSGILVIDKPSGMTSHDVVSAVRRATGERRVGHAGTLDPAATGVLVVLVGPATRLAPFLTAAQKTYDATVVFGTSTDTDDSEGATVEEASVPDLCTDIDFARSIVSGLVGESEQVPPAYSAIKREGRVSHRAARAGEKVDLEARSVDIVRAELTGLNVGPPPSWRMSLAVSKGTYIRAIARDLGESLGTAAHLGALRRTASGAATISEALTLEEVASAPDVRELFTDPVRLLGMNVVRVEDASADRIANGAAIEMPPDTEFGDGDLLAVVHDDLLLAVYRAGARGGRLTAEVVLPGGIRL
jgi:tRNA pseudouridine55 synthase